MQFVRRFLPALTALFVLAFALPAGAEVKELGQPADSPFPTASCPDNCQAVGQVSGYQVQIGTTKNPFLIDKPGKVVAFTIALGKPDDQQVQFFNNLFGQTPQARISVLKLAHKAHRARLKAQSEVFDLSQYLGSTPTFALDKPLAVDKRTVVALTIPTWAPAFAVGLGKDQAWRSSRDAADCNNVQQPAAQQTLGSLRTYG